MWKLENNGEQVISWHTKPLWDLLKNRIKDDITAKLASSLMAEYHQNVICALAIIYKKAGKEFLSTYLHPEYSLKEYKFENFDPLDLGKLKIIESDVDSKNSRSNQERYFRVAFESLEEFFSKDNRRHELYFNENTSELCQIANLAKRKLYCLADKRLRFLFSRMAKYIVEKKWSD